MKHFKLIAAVWMTLVSVAACVPVDMFEDLEEDGPNAAWMARLDDATPLADVSIPGAHEAASSTIWAFSTWTRTQELNVAELWNAGVRAFDIRPAYAGGMMGVYHDKYSAGIAFADIYSTLIKALDLHPTEFAIMLLRHEVEADGGAIAWDNDIHDILSAHNEYLVDYHDGITVGELRGKLLVLSRDEYEDGPYGGYISGWHFGTDLSQQQGASIQNAEGARFPLWVQDYYDPEGAEDKWAAVKNMLDATATAEHRPLVINHASGYVGKLPNYRKNANAINAEVVSYIKLNHTPVGIVMMDFAGTNTSHCVKVFGEDLVGAIMGNNR